MNRIFRFHNFDFYTIRYDKYHYTDNRKGAISNYIAYMIKGKCKIVTKTNTLYINEGDVFFIPINLSYESYWYGKDKIEFLSFGFTHIEAKEKLNFNLQIVDCDEELENEILKIPTEGSYLSCKTLSIFYDVLAKLIPYLKQQTSSKKDEIVLKATEYINTHTNCSVAEIAQNCFISEPYLYKLFKDKVGCSPNDYRLKVKCQMGIEYLLTTDKSVEEISSIIGLSSASHFRRILKSFSGLTPKEVRKNSSF